MKWTPGYRSDDVEVREGEERPLGGGGRGGGLVGNLLPFVISRFGLPGAIVLIGGFFLFNHFAGEAAAPEATQPSSTSRADPKSDPRVQFSSFVLDDVQKTWATRFQQMGHPYQHAKLIIYSNGTSTGCGFGDAATGPFYCPRDQHVYLDLDFFRTLANKLGAQGDFAQAYVIAHEVGHHVQNELGLTNDTHGRSNLGASGASVRIELQADCFAGIWAHDTEKRDILEGGDIDEALKAAASIGDDRLQKMGQGTVQPETWTHGSSAQRVAWFKKGYTSGDFAACDTEKTAMP